MATTDFRPDRHLALITGATGGIGKATCHRLAALGISIAVHYNSAKAEGEQLAEELQSKYGSNGVRAAAFGADLGDYDAIRSLHKAVTSTIGNPNILFLNAGTTGGISNVKDINDVSIDTFEQTWRVNCGANILLTQLFLPAIQKPADLTPGTSPWGRIIFCSSVAGFTGGVVGPHYASSKSALHGLIHWTATSVTNAHKSTSPSTPCNITINGIAPALISETKMLPGQNEELAKRVPVGRLGSPDEVAETVVWMLKTGYVNSKVIAVDGGMYIQ